MDGVRQRKLEEKSAERPVSAVERQQAQHKEKVDCRPDVRAEEVNRDT